MLGREDKEPHAGVSRRPYLRSVSWTDRSPTSNPIPKPQPGGTKGRAGLPPLSITRRPVEEWPRAGSDDLGVWPNPQTPRGSVKAPENSGVDREFQLKKDKLAFFDKECSRIAEHIYLGSDAVAKNREILRQNGITHVLNCVGFVCPEYFKSDLVYKTLWLQDSPSEDITSILYDVFDYFEDVREQGGRVLVHCYQGVSRSTSLVIAYLMWREGQSFEDAFQFVKAARGVTNPNMGFACQLLMCQKRVHAMPASPNSMLRMYRMAPHSSYDPLHLVPKMLNNAGIKGLDSRGAFIVYVPSAIYVWIGENCNSVMSSSAGVAANQVIKYERAKGPIVTIKEGEEPLDFWDALTNGQLLAGGCDNPEVRKVSNLPSENDTIGVAIQNAVGGKKVDDYDLDFELFQKALAGGVVPPFSVSDGEFETCLPARENGWGRLRQKFASGIMKEFVNSSRLSFGMAPTSDQADMIIDAHEDLEDDVCKNDFSSPSSPSTNRCSSPASFDCSLNSSAGRIRDPTKEVEHCMSLTYSFLPPASPCGSSHSFSSFAASSPKFSSKSPTLSPSTSDYASSFTFSPSSSNWSDLSYLSSQQPSPSALEATDLFSSKNACFADNSCCLYKEAPASPAKAFSFNHSLRVANTCSPCKGYCPSIAERRGSNPPPRMLLSSLDEPCKVTKNLVRSRSFSLPDLDDDALKDVDDNQFEPEDSREEPMLDAVDTGDESHSGTEARRVFGESYLQLDDVISKGLEVTASALYQWPSLCKVEMHSSHILDSRSAYMLLVTDVSFGTSNSDVLYVWLGHKFVNENWHGQSISGGCTPKDVHLHGETIGRNFLKHIGLPANVSLQIIREGAEPAEFRNHVNGFLISKG
ncbi:hypothetical protein SLEP1_g32815 [Rubroshorea leprosula]|uniref:Protein-tyrosine-phosphatase MKP1 n=1 Tax=Rubroshorea leprosula TaxID=152421 RepID=A0AAV5KEL5_9ROSI|nr:hypothetical protein SLEP1_g32815 [Rubroshorea leprosula]